MQSLFFVWRVCNKFDQVSFFGLGGLAAKASQIKFFNDRFFAEPGLFPLFEQSTLSNFAAGRAAIDQVQCL